MPLSNLPDWNTTVTGLHEVTMLVGFIHRALLPKRHNYMHLPLSPQPHGLTSHPLPHGGSIVLDFINLQMLYQPDTNTATALPFAQHSQASLFEALLQAMHTDAFSHLPTDTSLVAAFRTHYQIEDPLNEAPLTINATAAAGYAAAQDAIFTGLARFRARIEGAMTPLVVWPEHFDLATIFFPMTNLSMDEYGPHVSLGFAPYSPGQYERPYLYGYAYPYRDDIDLPSLAAPAFWNTAGWRGVVIHYDDIAAQEDPVAFVEQQAQMMYAVLGSVLQLE